LARGLNKTASSPAATRAPNKARCINAAADPAKPALFGGAVLADIDWSQPWFTPWRKLGEPTARQALQQQSVAEALNQNTRTAKREASASSGDIASAASVNTTCAGLVLGDFNAHKQERTASKANEQIKAVKFVPQLALPENQAYEDFIFKTAQVPTRDGLHDFFNGLCWQRFPLAKRRLNQLQAAELEAQGVQATRGPVRDALTLFDENVVLMHAPDAVWAALQARDWLTLFVDLRPQWQQVHLVLFGHALLEKLVTPYKSITAHVYRVSNDINPHDDAALDAWLVQDLQPAKLATKPFEPLPMLGVPGWWPANAERAYYEDTQVFRPKREAVLKQP
jgi:2C-methyl-D-erythritol 2,4-cyclodiphosphate synthase